LEWRGEEDDRGPYGIPPAEIRIEGGLEWKETIRI
jgi:hypothetical protein